MQAWEIITLQFVLCHGSWLFWFESPHHPGRYLGMIPGLPGRRLQLGSVEISGKMSLFGIRIPQALDGTNNYKANSKTSNFPVLIFACPHAENSSYYSCRLSQPPREICNIMAKWGTASSSDSFKVTQRRIHSFNLDGTMTEWTHTAQLDCCLPNNTSQHPEGWTKVGREREKAVEETGGRKSA